MSTLLLRFAGPLQSWGGEAKFDRRGTERLPSKSAVFGMLAAALGLRREDPLPEELLALRFGVRQEKEGVLLRDYHTAKNKKLAFISSRWYLADAVFLVGLEGDRVYLETLAHALQNPVFPLYLGRRSCPPAGCLVLGVREKALRVALQEEPGAGRRIVLDAEEQNGGGWYLRDVPVSFSQRCREYGYRRVYEAARAPHDAFAELEEAR
jgi:CRISPR system Cascade subunit CasD